MKRTTAEMDSDEFLSWMIRNQAKCQFFSLGWPFAVTVGAAYLAGLSLAASLIVGLFGAAMLLTA